MTGITDLVKDLWNHFIPSFRKRRINEQVLIIEDELPKKRLKSDYSSCYDQDSNIVSRFLKDSNTQTEESSFDMAKKDKVINVSNVISLIDDDDDKFDTAGCASSQSRNKENIVFKRRAPLSLKSMYKPPAHCSRLKSPTLSRSFASEKTSDVQFLGAFKADDPDVRIVSSGPVLKRFSINENVSKQPLLKRSVFTSDQSSSLRNLFAPTSFKRTFHPLKLNSPFKLLDLMSTKGYSDIVQQAVDKPQIFRKMIERGPLIPKGTVIDLTEDAEGKPKKYEKPIDLTDDDDDAAIVDLVKPVRQEVPRVNSMEKKLREKKIASENAINDLEKELAHLRTRYEEECSKINKEMIIKNAMSSRWQRALEERVKRHMKITQDIIDLEKEEEEEEPLLPGIPENLLKKVSHAWGPGSSQEVLISKFNYQIKRCDLKTLYGLQWLNDEVINFYMELIMQRCRESNNLPKVHTFNTFFYSKLSKDGHSGLKRWTRKIDIFSFDIILIPVHLAVHWCMAEINFKKKEINYYDSMGHPNTRCIESLMEYLKDEMQDKKKECFDSSGWKKSSVKDIPQQTNSSDCGVFACTFAEYISRKVKFTFSQDDMQFMRKKMAAEILGGQLLL